MQKVLINYQSIPDQFKFDFEIDGVAEQMIILVIFNFHHNLNALKDYPNTSNKMVGRKNSNKDNSDFDTFLNFSIYDHCVIENEQKILENKKNFKSCLNFMKEFVKIIMLNINEDNIQYIEKMVIILLYWLSINNDVFTVIIDHEVKKEFKFLNYLLQDKQEIKDLRKDKNTLIKKIEQINTMIVPIETSFHVNINLPLKSKLLHIKIIRALFLLIDFSKSI